MVQMDLHEFLFSQSLGCVQYEMSFEEYCP